MHRVPFRAVCSKTLSNIFPLSAYEYSRRGGGDIEQEVSKSSKAIFADKTAKKHELTRKHLSSCSGQLSFNSVVYVQRIRIIRKLEASKFAIYL